MNQPAFADTSEFYRVDATLKLDPRRRSDLGQFMTPVPIGRFMASLFSDVSGDIRLLDPGAGVGSLTAAFVERICAAATKPLSVSLFTYEIEPILTTYLRNTLDEAVVQCRQAQIKASAELYDEDFILGHVGGRQPDIFDLERRDSDGFSHVIMNPPYRKINSDSVHRAALREAGIETSNLYTGFMYLAAQRLRDGGEMVAIVPRSFCNGPYFKLFRKKFFKMMGLRRIHIFEKRNNAFKDDEVLQENIILHAVKGEKPSKVMITTSHGGNFHIGTDGHFVAEDMTQRTVPFDSVIRASDSEHFVHIAVNDFEQWIVDRLAQFTATLADIGVDVSTGPVVDFRLKDDLRAQPEKGTVPILYPAHFQNGVLVWPKVMKKPNAIRVSPESRKWLWENKGYFVVTKRFTSKEERRRIVASVYTSNLPGEMVGFENHLNVFHVKQSGISPALARGLALYLNSGLVDRYFRQFNGHTQVNATDLRALKYPPREVLERIGEGVASAVLSQREIDNIIEGELSHMNNDNNPLQAQQKIEDALKILTLLGMPRSQQNKRSALTLLALLNLKPSGSRRSLRRDRGNRRSCDRPGVLLPRRPGRERVSPGIRPPRGSGRRPGAVRNLFPL